MKRVTVALCVALIAALAAGAGAATKAKSSGKKKMAGGATSVTGCLQKAASADTYTLTPVASSKSKSAKAPADWTITGATADTKLSDHVGHKVKVTGTKEADHTLKFKSVKHISPTCP